MQPIPCAQLDHLHKYATPIITTFSPHKRIINSVYLLLILRQFLDLSACHCLHLHRCGFEQRNFYALHTTTLLEAHVNPATIFIQVTILIRPKLRGCGVVVSTFVFHSGDWDWNPGRDGEI